MELLFTLFEPPQPGRYRVRMNVDAAVYYFDGAIIFLDVLGSEYDPAVCQQHARIRHSGQSGFSAFASLWDNWETYYGFNPP